MKNEEEYNRTIEYMLEDEQNRLFSIKKESYSIEEKIKNVNKYQKIIKYNMNINEQEEEKFQELNQKIIDDIKIAEKVEENQNMTNEKVQNKIYDKENEVKELEEKVRELKAYKNTDLKTSKDELKDKVLKLILLLFLVKNESLVEIPWLLNFELLFFLVKSK